RPLSRDAVETALTPPAESAIRVAAERLHQPILQPVSIDLARGLSPEEAAVLAVIVNPELRAERDQRGIAAAQLLQAGLLPNPTLTAGLDFPYDSSPPDNFTAYTIGLEWEITALIARDQKRRAAVEAAAEVDLDVAWKEWQLAQEARSAAYGVMALEAQLAAARAESEELDGHLAAGSRDVDRPEKTRPDHTGP